MHIQLKAHALGAGTYRLAYADDDRTLVVRSHDLLNDASRARRAAGHRNTDSIAILERRNDSSWTHAHAGFVLAGVDAIRAD